MKYFFKKIIVKILEFEARATIRKYKPKVIAITGSVGKTTTKDAVYSILAPEYYVRKSEKSFNSQIGLPLTILGVPNAWSNPLDWFLNILKGLWLIVGRHKYPEWLVLEVGVGKPGDMAETASWLRTDVVIMTAIGETPVHVEYFKSRKHLVEEKSGLIKTLKKEGFLILNSDDETIRDMKDKTKSIVLNYGFEGKPDLLGSSISIYYENQKPAGIMFRLDEEGRSLPVSIPKGFGKNHVYAALGALTVARALGLNMIDAIEGLKNYEIPPGRMRLIEGEKGAFIIDDTYNSSPIACMSALGMLAEFNTPIIKRKIAVLGDMLELGRHTEEAHFNIGKEVKNSATHLVVVGLRAQKFKEGAIEAGMPKENIFEFTNSKEASAFVHEFIEKGDLILVKGSQGMRMERIVMNIMQDKENSAKLLVRQEKEWLEKE